MNNEATFQKVIDALREAGLLGSADFLAEYARLQGIEAASRSCLALLRASTHAWQDQERAVINALAEQLGESGIPAQSPKKGLPPFWMTKGGDVIS